MRLKRFYKGLLLSAIALTLVNLGTAQSVLEATVTAEVVDILNVAEINSLNFGRFAPEEEGGEITITPEGVRTSKGTVVLSSGEFNAATFRIHGTPDAVVSVLLPQSSIPLINPVTGKEMLIESWTASDLVSESKSVVLGNGALTLNVGATLIVGTIGENPSGHYSGRYEVVFTYN